MQLQPGRVRDMVDEVRWTEGCIPCHETLEDDVQAVCRGQFEAAPTQPLQIAARLGYVVAWDRPEKDLGHEWDTRPDLFAAGGRA